MTIKPFRASSNALTNNPDKVNAKLSKWLDEVSAAFRESPEFAALSKANKKSGGSWFGLFMDLSLNYVGDDLPKIDSETAREVMLDIMPRKMICSDTQAKTIVPELIAVWQFLDRELNAGSPKPVLKHAPAVISFLKEIRKDYLAIYNRFYEAPDEDDIFGDLTDDLTVTGELADFPLERLASKLQNTLAPTGGEDIASIIDCTAANLFEIEQSPEPPAIWEPLLEAAGLREFLQHVLATPVEDDPLVMEAVGRMFSFACSNLFIGVRQGDEAACAVWADTEQAIMQILQGDNIQLPMLSVLLAVLADYRQFVSRPFQAFIHDILQQKHSENIKETDFSPEQFHEHFADLMEMAPDEFLFLEALNTQLGFLPVDNLKLIVSGLCPLGEKAVDAMALMVLDNDHEKAAAVAESLTDTSQLVSPKTLSRLIRIRNWTAESVQPSLDRLIRNARKNNTAPCPPSPVAEKDIVEVHMSGVDGSGAQNVMMIIRAGRSFHIAGFILKESLGVVDAMISPPETRKRLQQYIASAKSQIGSMERVPLALVRQQLPFFIALNIKSKIAINPELIQVLELVGLDDWNPQSPDIKALYAPLISQEAFEDEVCAIQQRSEGWPEKSFGESWFVEDKKIEAFFGENDCDALYNRICSEVMASQRTIWAERLGRMALWAEHAGSKRCQQQSRDFAVVCRLLESPDIAAENIRLLQGIARNSMKVQSPVFF